MASRQVFLSRLVLVPLIWQLLPVTTGTTNRPGREFGQRLRWT